jgi:DNA-binding response OmpR family regulator
VAKILIAEDDLMIADMTEEVLVDEGYEVCGIARTVDAAVALAQFHKPDLILLDLRLADGGLGTEVAAQLGSVDGLGILYATGNMSEVMLTSADGHACLLKPYRPHDLTRGLEVVTALVATGLAPLPLPRGFQLLNPMENDSGSAA